MKKIDFIFALSQGANISKHDSKSYIDFIIDELSSAIASDAGVEIRNFGSFHRRYRKARLGVNPRTSEKTKVMEKLVPFFKPGATLKKDVNK